MASMVAVVYKRVSLLAAWVAMMILSPDQAAVMPRDAGMFDEGFAPGLVGLVGSLSVWAALLVKPVSLLLTAYFTVPSLSIHKT